MKPHFLRLLAFVLLSVMLATTAFADMGPKPSVTITVEGEQRVFYATLLSKSSSAGPSSYAEPGSEADLRRRERYTEQTLLQAYEAMQAYQDPDGFYFLGEVFSCPDGVFQCCYYPPDEFKMLLWFPDDGSLICSDSESRFAFESVYRGELADGRLTLHRELDIPGKALSFLARVAATLLLADL